MRDGLLCRRPCEWVSTPRHRTEEVFDLPSLTAHNFGARSCDKGLRREGRDHFTLGNRRGAQLFECQYKPPLYDFRGGYRVAHAFYVELRQHIRENFWSYRITGILMATRMRAPAKTLITNRPKFGGMRVDEVVTLSPVGTGVVPVVEFTGQS